MRFIPTRIHGILDYFLGAFLMFSPWAFHFWRDGAESWVPIVLGAGVIVYSLLTNYELGLAKVVPMRTHLWLDLASGIVLTLSPWLFGFSDFVYVPHVVLGLLEVGAAIMTDPYPYAKREPVTAAARRQAR